LISTCVFGECCGFGGFQDRAVAVRQWPFCPFNCSASFWVVSRRSFQLGLPAIQLFNGVSNAEPGFLKVVDAGLGCQQQAADGRELNFMEVEFGNQVREIEFSLS
jgi:hypothetical protein